MPRLAPTAPPSAGGVAVAGSTAIAGSIVISGYSGPATEQVERAVLDDVDACRQLPRDSHGALVELSGALATLGEPDAALRVAPDAAARDSVWWNAARRALDYGRDVDALGYAANEVDPEARVRLMLAVAQLRLLRGRPDLARGVVQDASVQARQGVHVRILADCALLLARCGDRDGAMKLFAAADQLPASSDQLMDELTGGNSLVLAQCEAQAGYYDLALTTAGHDANALHFVIAELCAARLFERAKTVAAQIVPASAGIGEYEAIAIAQCSAGRRDDAVATLDALLPSVQAGDVSHRSVGLVYCAMAYADAGRIETANSLYEQARHLIDYKSWLDLSYRMAFVTHREIFDRLDADGRARALYQALMVVRTYADAAMRIYPLIEIARAQNRNGDAAARTTLQEALAAANEMLDQPCTVTQIQTVLLVMAPLHDNKMGAALDADALANRIVAMPFSASDRENVAVMLAGADCFPAAFREIAGLKQLTDDTYRWLAKLQAHRQGASAALEWVLLLHPRHRAAGLAGIAEGLRPDRPSTDYPYPLGASWNLG